MVLGISLIFGTKISYLPSQHWYMHHTELGLLIWRSKIKLKIFSRYEQEGRGRKTIKAQQLWYAVIEAQTETGTPYMLYKDACNRKSNQQNLGTIKCSNLCTEIVEYSSVDEVKFKFKVFSHF